MREIYLDNSATTKIDSRVLEKMINKMDIYGNPSSIHREGQKAKMLIETSREKIAELLLGKPKEIIFTASGTEANNMAIKGAAIQNIKKGKHLISSKIEHSSVLNSFKELEKQGFEVSYIDADENGVVKLDELKKAIREDTSLISIMHANNELGTLQPIKEIGEICSKYDIIFHVDAVQSIGKLQIFPKNLNIDLLSFSAHKFYGPKGIAALYICAGNNLKKLLHGGAQERNRRSGTENTLGIYGMAEAMELAYSTMFEESKREMEIRKYLESNLKNKIDNILINGENAHRLPNITSLTLRKCEAQSLIFNLDIKGICLSAGSACSSGALSPSHVLDAINLSKLDSKSTIRISLGRFNTKADIDYFLEKLIDAVKLEREMAII